MNQELLEAYSKTNYQITNTELIINIGKQNKKLNTFLKLNTYDTWCFITAWNPLSSDGFTIEENNRFNNELFEDLSEYATYKGEGKDPTGVWAPEESYFVCNISREKSIELGKKYKQNAIVFGKINDVAELIILEKIL